MLAFQQDRPLVLAAYHVSGHGEQGEIVRSKGSRLVGAGQRPVGLRPRPPCVRPAAALEILDAMRFNTRQLHAGAGIGDPSISGLARRPTWDEV